MFLLPVLCQAASVSASAKAFDVHQGHAAPARDTLRSQPWKETDMTPVAKTAASADLMSGMMSRLHKAPLGARDHATQAHARRLRDMVLRCVACPDKPACAALQAMSLSFAEPPQFCPNTNYFELLPPRS